MTKPTVIAIMGHMTLVVNDALVIPGTNQTRSCEYAWGIYRDVDISNSVTDLPAYSAGYSNSWMVHKTGTLGVPALFSQFSPEAAYSAGQGQNDLAYRRYDLNLRRYKRVMDSANDTLILSVENNSGIATSVAQFAFSFYFRMLLLE